MVVELIVQKNHQLGSNIPYPVVISYVVAIRR
ncbi:hypothetical protein FH603_3144 [Spirosoma sp. LMG 31447]|uniref:Uncharacterized protein n=1 Tax=Spirosoma utsteinense TaxID=2585773 RepID=A0ABR6W7T6_9BACT|nr:hypothetical protein [Spirosoma utsteinense]